MDKALEKGIEIIGDAAKDEILSNDIIREIPNVRNFLDEGAGSYIVAAFIIFIIYVWITNIQYYFRKRALIKNINLKNAMKFYKILCRFGVSIQNHPKVWNELRSIFYNVNKSSQIPTELKKKLKAKLEKKGLVIDRITIIDNYVMEELNTAAK